MTELSNGMKNQKRKIRTNREIFVSFINISELSNKAEILKNKNCNKQRNKTDSVLNLKTKFEQKATFCNTVYNLCSNRI